MPYLDDPQVGIAQSPQFFDTHHNDQWVQRAAGADQELFYRWVQPSRDSLGAPICVGTCALYRRAALESAGGFAQISHSEDVHTGVAMMAAGYTVRYVPVILAKGLCPDGLPPFVSQQYRWCAGSMSLLVSPSFHAMDLSWRQRLCYWSGFGYYLSTAIIAFTAFIPPIYLLWQHPDAIHDRNYLLLLPLLLAYPLIMLMYRGRWDFSVLRIQMAQSFAHAVAIWDTWRGYTEEWVATGTVHRSPLGKRVGYLMSAWLICVQLLLWTGIIRDLSSGVVELRNMYPDDPGGRVRVVSAPATDHRGATSATPRPCGVARVSIDLPPPLTMTADPQLRVARPRPRPDVAPRRPDARPPERSRADRIITRGLTSQAIWLTPVLIVQAWFSFRLSNTLEDDEALYINAGHQLIAHILHGTRAPDFGTYFSGVPSLYSVPAAMIDHVGGVALVHATNTVMVMLATIFVYLSTRRLFGHPAALIAATVFAVNPAAIFVGRFASFDAPSLLLLAIALYFAVRSSEDWRFALATGPCLVLATAAKYFALAFMPSVLAILLVLSVQRVGLRRGLRLTAIAVLGLAGRRRHRAARGRTDRLAGRVVQLPASVRDPAREPYPAPPRVHPRHRRPRVGRARRGGPSAPPLAARQPPAGDRADPGGRADPARRLDLAAEEHGVRPGLPCPAGRRRGNGAGAAGPATRAAGADRLGVLRAFAELRNGYINRDDQRLAELDHDRHRHGPVRPPGRGPLPRRQQPDPGVLPVRYQQL